MPDSPSPAGRAADRARPEADRAPGPDAEPIDRHRPAVIDASVALKWVLPEPGSDAAVRLQAELADSGVPVHVPDLFWPETANALRRLARGPEAPLSPIEALEAFDVLRAAPLRTEPVGPVAFRALEIALVADATANDAAYVALAERLDAALWTADAALAAKLAGTEWEERVALLEQDAHPGHNPQPSPAPRRPTR